ncbi:MAG: hypothetical protein ACI841_002903 [Planctomycetota bacterium]|jgi:hypothetical protein
MRPIGAIVLPIIFPTTTFAQRAIDTWGIDPRGTVSNPPVGTSLAQLDACYRYGVDLRTVGPLGPHRRSSSC